ncbi:MAG: right-handed parallel beta-helix repeat-containing protein [Opitutaceae bacterium]|nr:right-handed parallel beta-helix repeat-containing protein [Verrucomicrobiales bacterium]
MNLSRPALLLFVLGFCGTPAHAWEWKDGAYQVYPGDQIQDALQAAARNPTGKVVRVHAGTYAPTLRRQALIWFNRAHDGIHLEAVGDVTLTAANKALSQPSSKAHPAVVNHVVYFGDGVSSNTVLQGFRITGANGFLTQSGTRQLEPDTVVPKNYFFYSDGGGIKVFGRSYPTIRDVEVVDNYTSPCGAGVSIQHQGFTNDVVRLENCRLLRNRTEATGSAVDLLPGSSAILRNCLFVGNVSNTGVDTVGALNNGHQFTNSGVLTVFFNSHVVVDGCTFAGNRNGVDDMSGLGVYRNSIFHQNDRDGGLVPAPRYELDLQKGGRVENCLINGMLLDPVGAIDNSRNQLNIPLQLDARYVPIGAGFETIGFRPSPPLSTGGKSIQ